MRPEVRRWMGRAALALCLLGVAGKVFGRELGFFAAPDPKVLLEIREDIRAYDDLTRWPAGYGEVESEGFVPCPSGAFTDAGWCLPPGTRVTVNPCLLCGQCAWCRRGQANYCAKLGSIGNGESMICGMPGGTQLACAESSPL